MKVPTDDEFFGIKPKLSEKAVSTTNTVSSFDTPQDLEGSPPEELKVENQTVSEILSLNSVD